MARTPERQNRRIVSKIMPLRDSLYDLILPLVKCSFNHLFRIEVEGKSVTEGPSLIIGTHLFPIEPMAVAIAAESPFKPIYIRGPLELVQLFARLFGIPSNSDDFEKEFHQAFDEKRVVLAFPEGNMPTRVRRRFSKDGAVRPNTLLVNRFSPIIFELCKRYEEEDKGIRIKYQPVGFGYDDEVIYSPHWESVPKAGTSVVVRFGDVQYSGDRDAPSLAKDLMAEAASLSGRELDERLFNRIY